MNEERELVTRFYEYNSMPNPNDHLYIPFAYEHMIATVVVIVPPILCLWFECQNDRMQRLLLKWPMMNHTNLDLELVI